MSTIRIIPRNLHFYLSDYWDSFLGKFTKEVPFDAGARFGGMKMWFDAAGLKMRNENTAETQFTFGVNAQDPTLPEVRLLSPYTLGSKSVMLRLDAETVVIPGSSLWRVNPADVDPITKLPKDGALMRHDSVDFTTGEDVSEMLEVHGKLEGGAHIRRKDLEKDNKRKWKP